MLSLALSMHDAWAMRLSSRLVAVSSMILAACSGGSSSDLFDPVTDQTQPTDPASGGGAASPSTSTGGSTSSSSGATSSSSSSSSGGSDKGTDPGASKDAGGAPPPACASESEPNDEMGDANDFQSCVSGVLKSKDVDWVKTVAPAKFASVHIGHSETGGRVVYRVYVNGVAYPSFSDAPPSTIPAMAGATYAFEIAPGGSTSGDRTWKLEVSFQ